MDTNKIGTKQAISVLCILSINSIIFSVSQSIITFCGSSSLLNILFIAFLLIIISIIFSLLFKNFTNQNILEISEFVGSKVLKNIIGILFICYFIFNTSLILDKISECMHLTYYPMTNIVFIICFFCLASGLACFLKNNSIFKACFIIAPLIFFIIILVFIGNCKNFDFNNIYPILGNGLNSTFFSGISNLFAFSGFSYIFFLSSKLEKPEKFRRILLISIIISAIFLIFCTANILLLFGENVSSFEIFPLYICVRCIEFGTFFQRLDSIFLFFSILSFVCFLALNIYIIIDILKEITATSDNKPFIFPTVLIIFGISIFLTFSSYFNILENNISKIAFFAFAILIPFIILVLANIKNFIRKDKNYL